MSKTERVLVATIKGMPVAFFALIILGCTGFGWELTRPFFLGHFLTSALMCIVGSLAVGYPFGKFLLEIEEKLKH